MPIPSLSEKWKWKIAGFGVVIVFGFCFFSGWLGRDFGKHWDEFRYVEKAYFAYEKGSPLPSWYHYPSLSYYLALPAIRIGNETAFKTGEIREDQFEETLIRTRMLFLFVSSLVILFTFFSAISWGLSPFACFLASALTGLSFEWNYHSRWIAPDALMAAMALLSFSWTLKYVREKKNQFLYLAAFFAGITGGAKYPGLLLLLPVMVAGFGELNENLSKKIIRINILAGFCILGFLISTPGALFEFDLFKEHIQKEALHYQEGHPGHNQNPGIEHAIALLNYFFKTVFSPFSGFSILIGILACTGFVLGIFQKKIKWVHLAFPLIYLLFFSFQKVMIVRNYLVLIPFFALFAASGFDALMGILQTKIKNGIAKSALQIPLFILLSGGLVFNAHFEIRAAQSIVNKEKIEQAHLAMLNYIRKHPKQKVLVTKMLLDYWKQDATKNIPPNIMSHPDENVHDDTWIAVATEEHPFIWRRVEANHPDLVVQDFGPLVVNFSAYPSWPGHRILILKWKYVKGIAWKF